MKKIIVVLLLTLIGWSNALNAQWLTNNASWLGNANITNVSALLDNNISTFGYIEMSNYSTLYVKSAEIRFPISKAINSFKFKYSFPTTAQSICNGNSSSIAYGCKVKLYYDNGAGWTEAYQENNDLNTSTTIACEYIDSIQYDISYPITASKWKIEMTGLYWLGGVPQTTTYFKIFEIGFKEYKKIHFVDINGNDNSSGTILSPYKTIAKAIQNSYSGDTIIINRGLYYEKTDLGTKNLVFASNYIFSKDTTDINTTIIDGNNTSGSIFYIGGGQNETTKFIGLTIQNGVANIGSGAAFMFDNSGFGSSVAVIDHCIIQNNNSNNVEQGSTIYSYVSGSGGDLFSPLGVINRIHVKNTKFLNNTNGPNGSCIRCMVSDIQIESCLFYNNLAPLCSAILSVRSNPTIINSIFTSEINSILFGGDVFPTAQPKLISNTFYDEGYSVKATSDVKLYALNNIFYGKGTPSIVVENQEFYESNNLYRKYNSIDISASGFTFTKPVFGDPKFVNPGSLNFNVLQNSPIINKGITSATLNGNLIETPNIDFYGNIRSSNIDIGAIQNTTLATGISDYSSNPSIKIFPNSTTDALTIDYGTNFSSIGTYKIKIYNCLGQAIYKSLITNQVTTLNLNRSTGKGMYIIELIDSNNNTIENKKIVLQ